MKRFAIPILLSLAVVALLIGLMMWLSKGDQRDASAPSLILYCAAGLKEPVAAVAEEYEKQYGVTIQIQYGGSGTLLSNMRISGQGDLYLAADSSYIEIAQNQGLVREAIPLVRMSPVIAVSAGNPKGIKGAADLLRKDVKVAIGAPSAASIGRQTELMLKRLGLWAQLDRAIQERGVTKPTVNEVANDVKIGSVDAGIVWDAIANQYPELESVPIEGAGGFTGDVTVGMLGSSNYPTAALRFARYLGASDKGLRVFGRKGFPPVEGDLWAEVPEIVYYSGGVNRLAIQDTLRRFEQREGVRITTVFNGCGILTGQVKLGERPDAYHTCDVTFMKGIEDFFQGTKVITENDIIIAMEKGNPLGIRNLNDLTRPGLRLGVTNEEQSSLGALTANLLKHEGIYEPVSRNVVTRTPTADLLINQIRTGSMDAAIVYMANVLPVEEYLDYIPIPNPLAKASQSVAVGKNSEHKHLVERLYRALHSPESMEKFRQAGFRWIEKGEEE